MTDSIRVELPDGESALIELTGNSGELMEYGADGIAKVPLAALRKAIHAAMQVANVLDEEVRSTFPDAENTEVRFGVRLEGTLDAKIVSGTAEATFEVTLKRGS